MLNNKEEEARQLSEVQASVDAQNAAIEANRIAMMEELRIRNWLEGQAILNAQIEQLENQGASAEQIAELREQGATQGFGTALQSASVLTSSLQRLQDEQDRQDLAEEQDLLEQLAEAQLQNNRDEQEQRIQERENQQAYEAYRQGEYVSVPILSEIACVEEPEEPRTWWQQIVDWFATGTDAAVDANQVRHVEFTPQNNGNYSVSAPDAPEGARLDYYNSNVLPNYDLPPGGNYAPSTINTRVATGLLDDAISGTSFAVAGVTSVVTNAIEYGSSAENLEEFSNQTIENQEFWVSTVVDTVLSVVIGLAAAAIVAGVLMFLGVTAPLWMTIVAVGLVSVFITSAVTSSGLPDTLDANGNMLIDDLQGQ
jgi:uncharacterized membrane protein